MFPIPIFNVRQTRRELQGGSRSVSELSHVSTAGAAVSLCILFEQWCSRTLNGLTVFSVKDEQRLKPWCLRKQEMDVCPADSNLSEAVAVT